MGERKGRVRFQDLQVPDFLDAKTMREVYNDQKERIRELQREVEQLRAVDAGLCSWFRCVRLPNGKVVHAHECQEIHARAALARERKGE